MSILDSLRNPPRVPAKQLNTCKGFEWAHDYYMVTAKGDVYTADTYRGGSKLLEPSVQKNGYLAYCLYGPDSGKKNALANRVVAAAWCDDWDPSLVVDHIDSNRRNNLPSNLRCITQGENIRAGNTYKTFQQREGGRAKATRVGAYDTINDEFLIWDSVAAAARFAQAERGGAGNISTVSYNSKHNTNLINGKPVNGISPGIRTAFGLQFYRLDELKPQHKKHFENATLL